MKRPSFLILPIILLSSCSLLGQKNDFDSVMQRHTEAQYNFIEKLSSRLGLDSQGVDSGDIRLAAETPIVGSGYVQADYKLSRNGRDYELTTKELIAGLSDIEGTESLILKDFGFLVAGGQGFMKLSDATGSLLDSALGPVIDKYRSRWIALTNPTLSLSGSTKEEQLAYRFSENFSKLTLKDMRKYSKEYPLWKLTRDNGELGGFYNYEVILDKTALKSFIIDLTNRLTEEPMDTDGIAQIDAILSGFDVTATIRIDTNNELYSDIDATLIPKNNPTQVNLKLAHTADGLRFSLGNTEGKITGSILFDTKKKKFTIGVNAVASGSEVGNLDGYIQFDGSKISETSLSISAQGLTASFIHQNHKDGTFQGKTVLPIGVLNWTGSVQDDALTNLFVAGQAIGGDVSLALTESGASVQGPFRLTFDNTPVFTSDVSLTMKKGLFALLLDIASPDAPETKSHIEMRVTRKSESSTSVTIEKPKDAIPYSTVSSDIDAALPVSLPSADIPSLDSGTGEMTASGAR